MYSWFENSSVKCWHWNIILSHIDNPLFCNCIIFLFLAVDRTDNLHRTLFCRVNNGVFTVFPFERVLTSQK